MAEVVRKTVCGFSCFNPLEKNQTFRSQNLRIGAAALGVISAVTGILILAGVPGLHSLGTIGGCAFIGGGSLLFLPSVILKRKREPLLKEKIPDLFDHKNADQSEQNIRQYSATEWSPMLKHLGIDDLSFVLETFSGHTGLDTSHLAPDQIQEQFSKAIILPEEIQSPSEAFNATRTASRILNSFLKRMTGEQLQQIPKEIINYLNLSQLSVEQVHEMFPTDGDKSDTTVERIRAILSNQLNELFEKMTKEQLKLISPEQVNTYWFSTEKLSAKTLSPLLSKINRWNLDKISETALKDQELDLSELDSRQLDDMFPALYGEEKAQKKLRMLHISTLNGCIENMSDSLLKLIPENQLRKPELDLSGLSKGQLDQMFNHYGEEKEIQEKLSMLHITTLNECIENMSGSLLKLIPENQLRKPELDLLPLKEEKKLNDMFPWFRNSEKVSERLGMLDPGVLNQIIEHMHNRLLALLPLESIKKPQFDWSKVSDDVKMIAIVDFSKDSFEDRLKIVPMDFLCRMFRNLGGRDLARVSVELLNDSRLRSSLSKLSKDQVHSMLGHAYDYKTQARVKDLSAATLNQILDRMEPNWLKLISTEQLRDPILDLSLLKEDQQFKALFPRDTEVSTKERLMALSDKNLGHAGNMLPKPQQDWVLEMKGLKKSGV